jgi:MFS family permease
MTQVDWNFRRYAKRLNIPVVKNRRTKLDNFPIERCRLEISLPLFVVGAAAIIAYGWTMQEKINLAGPIIMLFLIGWSLAACFQVLNVLLVDIYPGKGATVTAAVNLVRCEVGAGFAAFLSPLEKGIGEGWTYTLFACLILFSIFCLMIPMAYGMKWRQQQSARRAAREENSGGTAKAG